MNNEECLNQLNLYGHYCFKNFLSDYELKELIKLVDDKLIENNNKYFFLADKKLDNTIINEKKFISKFKSLFENLSIKLILKNFEDQKIYKVLRVVTGKKDERESHRYHFDAHMFTVLIPIIIPNREESENGDLIIFPNIRKYNSSLLINIFQKLLLQNRFSKFLLKNNYIYKNKKTILKLKPGNVYIFYGYRTLHGNLKIDPRDVRATILLHFYDVFSDSKLVKLNRKLRLSTENKIIAKNKILD